jgi:hypothetical protein
MQSASATRRRAWPVTSYSVTITTALRIAALTHQMRRSYSLEKWTAREPNEPNARGKIKILAKHAAEQTRVSQALCHYSDRRRFAVVDTHSSVA